MKENSDSIAIHVWLRGNVAFFLLGLCIWGDAAILIALAALLLSIPALFVYLDLIKLLAKRIRTQRMRFGILLTVALLMTELLLGLYTVNANKAYWCAPASTFLSVISVWNKLKDSSESTSQPHHR